MRASRRPAVVLIVAGLAGACVAVPAARAQTVAATPRQTRIESFTVPATHEIHGTFGASGKVQELNGRTWQAAASATVALYDRALPNGKWRIAGAAKTGSTGAFSWKPAIHKLGKYAWQARVEQKTVGTIEFKASDSVAKDTSFVDRTYATHFAALHTYGDTALGAIIQDYPQAGGVTYATVTGTAKFYYEPAGSGTWRYLGESKVDSGNFGSVAIEPVGTLDGTFRIVFPAQGNFLGSSATYSLS